MYGEPVAAEATLVTALRAVAAQAEDTHGVPVEVVTVGDVPSSPRVVALVQAAGEAIANAARHSGADRVDVYVEVAGRDVEVFVRDRGRGFDRATVPLDRLGVRNSILDRMDRHGGSAEVRSAPGEGTEVRLHVQAEATGE
jgi:signal transduction histidine kinase